MTGVLRSLAAAAPAREEPPSMRAGLAAQAAPGPGGLTSRARAREPGAAAFLASKV